MTTWTKSDGTTVQLAMARCRTCGMVLESQRPGDWVSCPCGNFVDTDRWMPERHRYGGDVVPIMPDMGSVDENANPLPASDASPE